MHAFFDVSMQYAGMHAFIVGICVICVCVCEGACLQAQMQCEFLGALT